MTKTIAAETNAMRAIVAASSAGAAFEWYDFTVVSVLVSLVFLEETRGKDLYAEA